MIKKRRKIDQNTKHLKGRVVLSNDRDITFPSSEEMFLRKLEEKILESCKGFEHAGITLDFFEIQIK